VSRSVVSFSPDDCMKITNGDARRFNTAGISRGTYPMTEFIASNYTYMSISITPLIWSILPVELFKIRVPGLLKLQI
jgi:hypothetical protein